MHLTHGVRRSALLYGERTALIDGDVVLTWSVLADRIARAAAGLRALGIRPGDRVAMLGHNAQRYVEFFYASFWAGAIAVPLNTRWAEPEIRHALDDSGARVLLADADLLAVAERQREAGARLHALVFADHGAAPDGWHGWDALIAAHPPAEDALRGGDDVACLFYTGGTTGRAKGVMLTHDNIAINSLTAMVNMDIRCESVHLHVSPLFHVAGGARVFSVTLAGATHVMLPRFEVDGFLEAIERARVTITIIVPTMLNRLVQHPELTRYDLSSLELLTYGASPMPEALLRSAMERLPGVRFLQAYGMTELSPTATMLGSEYHVFEGPNAGRTASAGRPVLNADVRIEGEDGRVLPAGEVGEICVRGPMVMKGYWNLPELTAETLRDGWMHTGDAGYLDADGFVFLVDRVKDMIVSGGENVYSAEVEDALYKHPAVAECAVIGVPSERWGEAVHAIVVVKPGQSIEEAELIEHCRGLIASYKCPRSVELRREELPKSGPGKILKSELRQPHWAGRDRSVG